VDIPTLFSEDNTSATGSAPADGMAPASDDSAIINTDELLGTASDGVATDDTAAAESDSGVPTGQIGDPLAGVDDSATDDSATTDEEDDIVPNETITTNDWSKVGDVRPDEMPTMVVPESPALGEALEPEIVPEIVPEAPPFASELKYKLPGVDDPEKIAFIKTYTEEFDEALKRATGAAESILDAIDKAVHEHSPSITVPDAADEFLAKKPADNKVEKFEDAREIVREVLARAADAKAESAKAAEEAARIYDEVQAFKKETKDQIAALVADQLLSQSQSQPEPQQ
jgi:hypothetical protein